MEQSKQLEALILDYLAGKFKAHLQDLEYLGYGESAKKLEKEFMDHFDIKQSIEGKIANSDKNT